MTYGYGDYRYEVQEGWLQPPQDYSFGWIPAVACDSLDRVYVYSRSEHPMAVFDREGKFLTSWGEGVLADAHGIYIDQHDFIYCTERNTHCVRKFTSDGTLLLTIGTPGAPGQQDGAPFNLPTDLDIAPNGDLYISDGYGNARVHRYSSTGELLHSWGGWGDQPGQFSLSHCVRIDRYERVWVCDRENRRIQIFDLEGNFLTQWQDLAKPDTIYFHPHEDVVYIAELEQQISIYSFDQQLLSQWGGRQASRRPGEFLAFPHGIWADSQGDLYVGEVQADGRLQKFIRQ